MQGIINIHLTDGDVAVRQTSWGAIKSLYGDQSQKSLNSIVNASVKSQNTNITPYAQVDLEVNGLLPEGTNVRSAWMIPDQTIAYPYGSVDKLVEMLKNATHTFDTDADQIIKGSHFPIVGWDVNSSPVDWPDPQFQAWKDTWQYG